MIKIKDKMKNGSLIQKKDKIMDKQLNKRRRIRLKCMKL